MGCGRGGFSSLHWSFRVAPPFGSGQCGILNRLGAGCGLAKAEDGVSSFSLGAMSIMSVRAAG